MSVNYRNIIKFILNGDTATLREHVTELSLHSALCPMAVILSQTGEAPIVLVSEESVDGLASVLSSKCNGCGKILKFNTSPIVKTNKNTCQREINVKAVRVQLKVVEGTQN